MRIAVYPTSANPPTYGHADILVRTTKQFDHVFWSAALNAEKHYMFNEEVRVKMMNEYVRYYDLKNVTVEAFSGSTIRYVQERNAQVIVKGLRSLEDFQGEFQQAVGNKGIDPDIETFCLFGKPDLFAISSTLVRELAFMGESIEAYVLPSVAEIVSEVIKKNSEFKT
ncbi:MAG TPA: pantetheine-phosphate adenylyltransferase [Deltaproteobacteria bacterium]|jgi:pantetheine-phosphate adenylyltransferase|nr:pantetheine-phosphate adenylyltransferase [SAR324 cluster bacterium]HBL54799.1 pantetheine-phosphate adenylyltransferase [Deltaproteobacteria bacterium]HHZ79228.1 pantetheine-phosphate adenylyltransferase [Candidatus Lambdaproteobacteria bacterium]HIA56605.1 pantetheine-phosphate adenylyltransferase [Candidatus Lambdaproteobacteria bacterium]HIN48458.1 pantetheine-phosphate adenylyltransferase [Deltaproteobacteria bacterium]